jgi:uroporphyrin-III C-methyltransferase/precorrin-2 dehydrogenase/sirohydrochlorin ferrochelatase
VRLAGRPVILVGTGDAAEAKRRLLERAGAIVVGEEASAPLASVLAEEDAAAAAIVGRLRARGILVNAVDRPGLCDFTLPAIVDRNPVLIAIGTGGASAGLAKTLRQRLEALLPDNLGRLADALHAARAQIRARWPSPDGRRRAIDRALDGPLDPLRSYAPGGVERWIAEEGSAAQPELIAVRLRSDDPDALTLRDARLLGAADRIYHRADIPGAILDRARADAARIVCPAPPADPPQGLSLDIDWEAR